MNHEDFFTDLFSINNKLELDKTKLFKLLRNKLNLRFRSENIIQLNKKIGVYCNVEYNKHKKIYTLHKVSTGKYSDFIRKNIELAKTKSNIKTYLIKDSRSGLYKIGKSLKPKVRERTLQSEYPLLRIVKLWDYNIESNLHEIYKRQRIRGEWFELSKIQVRYICTHI